MEATLESAIAAARRLGLPVYTLGLGNEEEIATADLKRLASSTRAQYYAARNSEQLRAIYESIAERIGASYSLVYESDRRLPDGTLRPVQIFHKGSRQAGETAVFIPGMVVPAGGWSPLFLILLAALFGPRRFARLAGATEFAVAGLIRLDARWRERMGIEPTRSLFPNPSPVLKTGPGTSRGHAPGCAVGEEARRIASADVMILYGKFANYGTALSSGLMTRCGNARRMG